MDEHTQVGDLSLSLPQSPTIVAPFSSPTDQRETSNVATLRFLNPKESDPLYIKGSRKASNVKHKSDDDTPFEHHVWR